MSKLTIRDVEIRGKRVLTRVDFNVPIEERGDEIKITDDTRIREALPTLNYLREHGAKTILMSHFGRPKGKRVQKYTLRPLADHLHTLINHPVAFATIRSEKSRRRSSKICATATSRCCKICVFSRRKKQTTRNLPERWLSSATFL